MASMSIEGHAVFSICMFTFTVWYDAEWLKFYNNNSTGHTFDELLRSGMKYHSFNLELNPELCTQKLQKLIDHNSEFLMGCLISFPHVDMSATLQVAWT